MRPKNERTYQLPTSAAAAGLQAVAEVSRLKGSLGVAALKEGLAAHAVSKDTYSVDANAKLKKRVQGIYDKKVAKRKQLADVIPRLPEDAASASVYGAMKKSQVRSAFRNPGG